jgi:hypothetical protein
VTAATTTIGIIGFDAKIAIEAVQLNGLLEAAPTVPNVRRC